MDRRLADGDAVLGVAGFPRRGPLLALPCEGLLGGRLGCLRAVLHVCGLSLLDYLHGNCTLMCVNGMHSIRRRKIA